MVERLDLVRYFIIGGALVSAFMNLIDELNKGSGLWQILYYSGALFFIAVFLIVIDKDWAISTVLLLGGFLMMVDDLNPGKISAAIMLFGFGLYLSKNIYLNYIVYLVVALIIISSHVFKNGTPEDTINVLVGYAVFFALNELIYKKRPKDVKTGG